MTLQRETIDGAVCLTPASKSGLLVRLARDFGLRVFVETGTACGDSCIPMLEVCDEVYSCDVNPEAIAHTRGRCGDARLRLECADAREFLRDVTPIFSLSRKPWLFWLDAHFLTHDFRHANAICPLRDELRHLADHTHGGDMILVDDVRLFSGGGGYPSIAEIRDMFRGRRVDVRDDILRISVAGRPEDWSAYA